MGEQSEAVQHGGEQRVVLNEKNENPTIHRRTVARTPLMPPKTDGVRHSLTATRKALARFIGKDRQSEPEPKSREEQIKELIARTPSREQIDGLFDNIRGMFGYSEGLSGSVLKELASRVYSGEESADSIPERGGLRKIVQSRSAVDSLQHDPETPIPEPLTRGELSNLVSRIPRVPDGPHIDYSSSYIQGTVTEILDYGAPIETMPRAFGLRDITLGVLQRQSQEKAKQST